MLKNYVNEGFEFEKKMSFALHTAHTPVLLSSLLLRQINLGQVDICVMKSNLTSRFLVLYECKTQSSPSINQKMRLQKTAEYLSTVLGMSAKIEVIFAKKAKLNYP